MARITGSWLSGPPVAPGAGGADDYAGAELGLPREGAGSLPGMFRRIVAMMVDWFIAVGISALIAQGMPTSSVNLLLWFVIGIAAVTLFGFTPGQYFLRIRVIRVDADAPVGFLRALGRQMLLVFVIPALFTDADGRGMHDRATGTAVVRSR
ncbi:RDD family protein [Nocardia sp. NBC_01329]|uniref:RDD family protein n=1 Tax=Nocardia sp. NBC_01329 TaxID=2903594 RepID=UPI002E0D104F|nr:RDD family protein [Nocardia sp. NBC_01329]